MKYTNKSKKRQLLEAIKYWSRFLREDVTADETGFYDLDDAYMGQFIDIIDQEGLDPDISLEFFEQFKADSRGRTRKSPAQLAAAARVECGRSGRKTLTLADLAAIKAGAQQQQSVEKDVYDMTGGFSDMCRKYGGKDNLYDMFDDLLFVSYTTERGKYGTTYHLVAAEDQSGNKLDKQVELIFHNSKAKTEFCQEMWGWSYSEHVKPMAGHAQAEPKSEINMRDKNGNIKSKYRDHTQVSQRGKDGKMWGTVDERDSVKKYSKRQVLEALAYWKKQLKTYVKSGL